MGKINETNLDDSLAAKLAMIEAVSKSLTSIENSMTNIENNASGGNLAPFSHVSIPVILESGLVKLFQLEGEGELHSAYSFFNPNGGNPSGRFRVVVDDVVVHDSKATYSSYVKMSGGLISSSDVHSEGQTPSAMGALGMTYAIRNPKSYPYTNATDEACVILNVPLKFKRKVEIFGSATITYSSFDLIVRGGVKVD